ncbi:MAG: hypothetical protein ACK55S_03735, partial [Planctomycetota bacterium]
CLLKKRSNCLASSPPGSVYAASLRAAAFIECSGNSESSFENPRRLDKSHAHCVSLRRLHHDLGTYQEGFATVADLSSQFYRSDLHLLCRFRGFEPHAGLGRG